MHSNLVHLESFHSEAEAECARNWLECGGVDAFIEGTVSSTILSHISSVLPGVRLFVGSADLAAATRLLHEYRVKDSDAVAWFCSECLETNEPSFDMCWKCGGERTQVGAALPTERTAVSHSSAMEERAHVPATSSPHEIVTNPYHVFVAAPPPQGERQVADDDSHQLSSDEADEIIQRALRAAILGCLLPVIANTYSVFLLILSTDAAVVSDKSKRRRRVAWAINLLLLVGNMLFFQALAR